MRAAKSILGRWSAPLAICLMAGCWFVGSGTRTTSLRPIAPALTPSAANPRQALPGEQDDAQASVTVRSPQPARPALAERLATAVRISPIETPAVPSVAPPPAPASDPIGGRHELRPTALAAGLRPAAEPAPPPIDRQRSGILFRGRSEDVMRATKDMERLLAETGWTAGQVHLAASADGESLCYSLNSPADSTDTLAIAKRPELMLTRDVIRYQDRLGQVKELSLVSQKEILATMLVPGRLFEFNGANCSVEQLREQVAIRQNIVFWGSRADWVFPEDKIYRYNTADCWQPMNGDDWTLRAGMAANHAIADAFVGRFAYQIGCTSACRFIVAHGILDYFDRARPDAAVASRLAQMLDPLHPFLDIAPVADRAGAIVRAGRLLDRHFNVPWNHWVPGDWGWIKNTDDRSSEELGSEGCNIIYGGGGLFVNYYPERPPKTLAQAISRVYGWRFGLEEEELKLDEATFSLLRCDPRAGGMLRDVRDFPKFFRAPSAVQPGA